MSMTQTNIDVALIDAAPAAAQPDPASGRTAADRCTRAEAVHAPPELFHILHMRVPIIVKLAERDLPVSTVLKLNIGSILEFDRPADAEMELLVNNRTIGRGMPVKVGENFGLRLTAVGALATTIQALGD